MRPISVFLMFVFSAGGADEQKPDGRDPSNRTPKMTRSGNFSSSVTTKVSRS
jgi:hypothetical protein